eukprot:415884_1
MTPNKIMNGLNIVVVLVVSRLINCCYSGGVNASILDCNYVEYVSIEGSPSQYPGAIPIGVCEQYSKTQSRVYECTPNGDGVILKYYRNSNSCSGSNFVIYPDDSISYSSFKCDSAFICPYVQFTKYLIQDSFNPCQVDMDHIYVTTLLTGECYDGSIFTCTNVSWTEHIYNDQKCSGTPENDEHQVGCKHRNRALWYPKVTCNSGTNE